MPSTRQLNREYSCLLLVLESLWCPVVGIVEAFAAASYSICLHLRDMRLRRTIKQERIRRNKLLADTWCLSTTYRGELDVRRLDS